MSTEFEARQEDVGNIVSLEHVNLTIPDQLLATLFYVVGLGFTRDPYMNVGLSNIWINVGENQFHLPTRATAQVMPGTIGLAVPDLDALAARLEMVTPQLSDSMFAWSHTEDAIAITCPWGNHFKACAPSAQAANGLRLGIPYLQLHVPAGTAPSIAHFYDQVLGAPAKIETVAGAPTALVSIGRNQHLLFTETNEPIPDYDGHHIAIYVADFSGPHDFLRDRELITEDPANHQLRFQNIVDPDSGEHVFTLEHEVRSLKHPMYRRPLINRNPSQTQVGYQPGQDAFVGA
jgi:hypothetical protein